MCRDVILEAWLCRWREARSILHFENLLESSLTTHRTCIAMSFWLFENLLKFAKRVLSALLLVAFSVVFVCGLCLGTDIDELTSLEQLIHYKKQQGIVALQKQCAKSELYACFHLGILHSSGENLDYKQSASYYAKACEGSLMAACNNLGVMYLRGQGVKADSKKAIELYRAACNGGSANGCNNLGVSLELGIGLKKNYAQAGVYYASACENKSSKACYNLADLTAKGKGVKKNKELAKQYYGLACDFGSQEGCEKYKELSVAKK